MDSSGLVAILVVAVLETVLSATFTKFYFTVGLPLLRLRVAPSRPVVPPPQLQELLSTLPESASGTFAFSQIDDQRVAFRERFFGNPFHLTHTPVIHGLLKFNSASGEIEVVGLANWYTIAFVLVFVQHLPSNDGAAFLVFLVGVLLLIYAIQFTRYRSLAAAALDRWTNNATTPGAG